ncbi:hypothetical protein Xmau_00669 [Xenorhabdus mauleonii]|uniref:Uncharacterized protein n=1 Tax=Xenorhabdus mauleonii TaxID=351675 RepID=A0A1I3JNF4_9GAMM|nr:hypothetical protein Xmau_00669 [Xenorhabdus mauleonii]SFI61650.1 hypothetical protein SAMN05421680_102263 [Xenorhabdus mauleonii]
MIFLALRVFRIIIFFPLFMIISYFFISERSMKKSLLLSLVAATLFFLIDIFIPTLILYPSRVLGLLGFG